MVEGLNVTQEVGGAEYADSSGILTEQRVKMERKRKQRNPKEEKDNEGK